MDQSLSQSKNEMCMLCVHGYITTFTFHIHTSVNPRFLSRNAIYLNQPISPAVYKHVFGMTINSLMRVISYVLYTTTRI